MTPDRTFTHTVFIEPKAWARPRPCRGGRGYYNPHQTYLDQLRWEFRTWWGSKPLLGCPLELDIVFGMPIPKGTSRKRTLAMCRNDIKHTKTPDRDNLVKAVKDGLEGSVYTNDKFVWKGEEIKIYAEKPFVHIILRVPSDALPIALAGVA